MNRLCAVFHRDGRPAAADELEPMIVATGPDASWVDLGRLRGPCGIWSRPVAVPAADAADSALYVDPVCGLTVAVDGRLDNRCELLAQLGDRAAAIRTGSDAEVIAAAYTARGWRCFADLLGDFAIVLWDADRQCLVCARDPLGLKPLYYTAIGDTVVCASELRQLLACPGVDIQPNEGMIAEYLAESPTSTHETLYRNLLRLPPAHLVVADRHRVAVRRYWRLELGSDIRCHDDREYEDGLRKLLAVAVRCRVPDAAPIAAQLSGGLDSTLVAGLLHRELESPGRPETDLQLCAMVYPDHPAADEREWVERASSFLGRRAELSLPRPPGAADFAEWARSSRDFPPYPGDLECGGMMQLAADSGARVMFTGNGGDDWFWGVEGFGWSILRRVAAASGSGARRRAVRAIVGSLARATMPPGVLRSVRRLRRPSWRWIPDAFSRRTDLADRVTVRPRADLDPRVPGAGIAAKLDDGYLIHGREMAERYAAAWGFEERHPLYDRRVIEFAASVPGDQLYRDGSHRFVLRGAARGLVPEEIRTRSSKAEFSHIVTEALLQPDVVRALGSLAIADAGWVRGDQIAAMLAEVETLYQNGATGYTRWAWPLWMVFGIETWYREVFFPE